MKRTLSTALSALALTGGIGACGSSAGGSRHLSLVAYSTPQKAYAALIEAFQGTPAGRGVTFSQSYGASGQQSRAVLAGLPADVVALSLDPDVSRLAAAGLVSKSWNSAPDRGEVSDTLAVIIVRRGNPRHITGWRDLVKPGVQVVTPNPISSGSARWNVLGAYGAQVRAGRSPAQAQAFVTALFHHVVSQDSSARNAEQTFLAGRGDALLDYESEGISLTRQRAAISYVIPSSTVLIENPAAVVARGGHSALAGAFLSFLRSRRAQAIFAAHGFRPTVPGVAGASSFPAVPGQFTAASLGGWTAIDRAFFDPATGWVTRLEQSLGAGGGH